MCNSLPGSSLSGPCGVSGRRLLRPGKLKDVQQNPLPASVRAVGEFLGLVGYYRMFVPNFIKVAAPLHALTRPDVSFIWTEQCNTSFERLKILLSSPPCWRARTLVVLLSFILMLGWDLFWAGAVWWQTVSRDLCQEELKEGQDQLWSDGT